MYNFYNIILKVEEVHDKIFYEKWYYIFVYQVRI